MKDSEIILDEKSANILLLVWSAQLYCMITFFILFHRINFTLRWRYRHHYRRNYWTFSDRK